MRRARIGQTIRLCIYVGLTLATLLASNVASAQNTGSRAVPQQDYLLSFPAYYDGDYAAARKSFNSAASGRVITTDGRWVDSICYHTMLGECYFQVGDRRTALEEYTSAIQLAMAYKSWLISVEFPDTITEMSSQKLGNITWGRPTRSTLMGKFPDTMLCAQGRIDNESVVRQGGVVEPPRYVQVRVHEIVRCTALAIARRREIMGAVSELDPLTNDVLNKLSGRPGLANHWSQAWVSVQLGLAYSAAGKRAEAIAELTKGLQVGGRYDHPLTALALIELGKLALVEEKYDVAAAMFYEATFPAVAYDQHDMLEEAFRWGSQTYLIAGKQGIYPPLEPAQTWARTKGSKTLQASLLISSAEGLSNAGNPAAAAALLEQANAAMNRSDMRGSQIGARYQYEVARVNYGAGKLAAGNQALAACMTLQKNGSRRLFQLGLADALYISGKIRIARQAEMLYDDVLREPTAADWQREPMESLTFVMTPHLPQLEHWFEVAIERKQMEKAAEIADLIRRQRFYSTTPTGGRTLSFRWLLEAPETTLSDTAKLQRRDLLAKYPKYAELSKQATALQAKLAALPREDKNSKAQTELFTQLASISAAQEVMISDLALRREPAEAVFPPALNVKQLQQRLQKGQLVLAYFTTARYVVGFAITKESCKPWQLTPTETLKVKQDFAALLKQWGQTDKNALLQTEDLRKEDWKPIAVRLLSALTNKAKAEHFAAIKELIIVPDGILWYMPFDALQLETAEGPVPLISKLRVRYAPTMGLAVPDGRAMPRTAQTMIVSGRMYAKEDEAASTAAAGELAKIVPGSFVAPTQLPAPGSLYSSTIDRLIVLDDIGDAHKGPLDWSPLRRDSGNAAGALGSWAALPWAGPQQVVVPGYHTAAESSLKGGAAGDEVFLTAMTMMASGSRTILLSRWRTGGQTAYDLTREFTQELPHTSAANAWQRAVQLVTAAPLDIPREPRIRAMADEALKPQHPFFWGGYLLLDTGVEPAAEQRMKSIVAALRGTLLAIRNLEAKVLIGLLLLTLAGLSFAWLANQVMDGDTHAFDEWALSALRVPGQPDQPIGPAWLKEAAHDITALGGLTFVALLIAAVAGYFLLQQNYGPMLVLVLSSGSGAIVGQLLKKVFDRPRPSHVAHLVDVHTSSFPSGHSMLSAIVFLTLGVLLARFAKTRRLKAYYLVVAVVLTLLVGMSRAYLGVHYPTDILAGWAAGLGWALLCWLIARRLQKRHIIEEPRTE